MIGAQAKISILDFDLAVSEVKIPFLPLLFGFKPHAGWALQRWRAGSLRGGRRERPKRQSNAGDQRKESASPASRSDFL
jgi:hypothetical protein